MSDIDLAAVIGFDPVMEMGAEPAEMKAKYLAERDKRLRDDGNEQYVEVEAEFSHYVDDPYVEPGFTREPVFDDVEFAIIGGGFGGLLMGARLREAGYTDLRIVEKAGDFGGTWYWNRYPGRDVRRRVVRLPAAARRARLHPASTSTPSRRRSSSTAATSPGTTASTTTPCSRPASPSCAGTRPTARWIISTDRGDRFTAQYVAMANGPLNRPKLPGIPGINEFKGHTFHTSRWDYDYTGGDSTGNLDKLADKRVGIIGTGATAIQCIPHLGERPRSCTSSSARRRRSTCATTPRPIPSGPPR